MNERINDIVQDVLEGEADCVGVLSTGERCFVALAANRYDLLPAAYSDPVVAWYRLDRRWRAGVCQWRGWPCRFAVE